MANMDSLCTCSSPSLYVGIDFGMTLTKINVYKGSDCRLHQTKPALEGSRMVPGILQVNSRSSNAEFPREAMNSPSSPLVGHFYVVSLVQTTLGNYEILQTSTCVVGIFLEGIWDLATQMVPYFRTDTPRHAAITWTSYWDSDTRQRLEAAVDLAGIVKHYKSVLYVTEDKAAAYGLYDQDRLTSSALANRQHVMIVDIGGLTTDISTVCFMPSSNETVRPITKGRNSFYYGALSVDVAIQDFMNQAIEEVLGKPQATFPATVLLDSKRAMEAWIKSQMNRYVVGDLTWPGFEYVIDGRVMTIHRDDVIKIYNVTEAICGLICKQYAQLPVGERPKHLFLVGGLSRNSWVKRYICNILERDLPNVKLDIVAPADESIRHVVSIGAALMAWEQMRSAGRR
ncbi:hypothetical protein HJFPF1_06063 [Paramyrothecium foliicola]|nr:hypothetical protein HJFPF1_06063 [Paramyrothecium foliicola]